MLRPEYERVSEVRGENRARESVLLQQPHQHNCLTSQDCRSLHTLHIVTMSHISLHSYLVMSWQPRMVMIWISPGDDSSANWVRSLTTGRLDSRRVRRAFWFAAVLTEIIWGPSSRARLSLLAKCIANNLTREIAMPTDKHRHFIYFHYTLNVLHYLLSRNSSG